MNFYAEIWKIIPKLSLFSDLKLNSFLGFLFNRFPFVSLIVFSCVLYFIHVFILRAS